MKAIVKITIPPDATGRGSIREYVVDVDQSDHGTDVAALITESVDTRADHAGRLAELRRHLGKLAGIKPRVHRKPSGAKSIGGRVQYVATSRMSDKAVAVQLRHHGIPADIAPNHDEPTEN